MSVRFRGPLLWTLAYAGVALCMALSGCGGKETPQNQVNRWLDERPKSPLKVIEIQEGLKGSQPITPEEEKTFEKQVAAWAERGKKITDVESVLMDLYRDAGRERRIHILMAFFEVGTKVSVPFLCDVMESKAEAPGVSGCAAVALRWIGDNTCIERLGNAAVSDTREYVRYQAVEALGRLKDPAAVKYLEEATKDKKGSVRNSAKYWLGTFSKQRASPN